MTNDNMTIDRINLIRLVMACAVVLALLLPPAGTMAQEPEPAPPVPLTPVGPSNPVTPEPEPDPVGQQALAAFQLVLDSMGSHDRGDADLAEAQAGVTAAQGTLTRAEQRLADVESERNASATTLIQNVRAAIVVLEALILEYSPAAP